MSVRKVGEARKGAVVGKVFFNPEWEEYCVELWVGGKPIPAASYFCPDVEDAKASAEVMVAAKYEEMAAA